MSKSDFAKLVAPATIPTEHRTNPHFWVVPKVCASTTFGSGHGANKVCGRALDDKDRSWLDACASKDISAWTRPRCGDCAENGHTCRMKESEIKRYITEKDDASTPATATAGAAAEAAPAAGPPPAAAAAAAGAAAEAPPAAGPPPAAAAAAAGAAAEAPPAAPPAGDASKTAAKKRPVSRHGSRSADSRKEKSRRRHSARLSEAEASADDKDSAAPLEDISDTDDDAGAK
jgi:hypothetical protein